MRGHSNTSKLHTQPKEAGTDEIWIWIWIYITQQATATAQRWWWWWWWWASPVGLHITRAQPSPYAHLWAHAPLPHPQASPLAAGMARGLVARMGGWGDAERGKRGDVGRQGARGPGLRLRDAASAQLSGSGNFLPLHFLSVCHRLLFTIMMTTLGGVYWSWERAEHFRWYPLLFPGLFQLMLLVSGRGETR